MLAAYFPVALWEGDAHLYLPSAAAAAAAAASVPLEVAQRYLACINALDEQGLGNETPRALFCTGTTYHQQQQLQQQQRSDAPRSFPSLAQSCLQRLALDCAGAVVLAAYFPLAVWEGEAHLYLQQLPFVTAATEAVLTYWTAVQRYLECLDAISEIGEREPCALFPDPTNNQQHQQQPQESSSEAADQSLVSRAQAGMYRLVLDLAGASLLAAYLPVVMREGEGRLYLPQLPTANLLSCLQVIGQLGGADAGADTDADATDDINTCTAAEQSHQVPKKMLLTGHATAAGGAARLPAPMQAGKGFLQCLTAIGQLGGEDDSDTPAQPQQGGLQASAAKAAPAPAACAAAGWRSPFESAQGFLHCVTAVGHLAADDME